MDLLEAKNLQFSDEAHSLVNARKILSISIGIIALKAYFSFKLGLV